MTAKHTPGPWKAVNAGNHWNNPAIENWIITYGPDGEQIVDHVYEKQDAMLIASAPALLAALKELQGQLSRYGDWDDGCFYLNGRATPELENGMRLATAALSAAEEQGVEP